MTRGDRLLDTLDLAVGLGAADAEIADADAAGSDAWSLALSAFDASWGQRHERAVDLAAAALRALPEPWTDDPEAAVLACASAALAAAGVGIPGGWTSQTPGATPTGDPIIDALPLLPRLDAGPTGAFARFALAEAALACARLELAAVVADTIVPTRFPDRAGGAHPFGAIVDVMLARVAAFHGRIDEAGATIGAVEPTGVVAVDSLVLATASLVGGNAADPRSVADVADVLERSAPPSPPSRLATGPLLLVAFGLVALGEVRRAAGLALRTIAGPRELMLVDRALAIEIALAAAVLDADADAAQSWVAILEPFAGDAIVASTVARMRSRVALLVGDTDSAIAFADESVTIARAEGRAIEAAEGEIVAARARIAAGRMGEAGRRLSAAAADGDRVGHRSVRRSAVATLRIAGRRLPPAPGSGGAGLSARELEVLDLLLRGLGNAEIASQLHLSPHTVRVHVSRVLAAHGAPTRFALVAGVAARRSLDGGGGPAVELESLTARQRDVVIELITGASNPEIAGRLGIAVRTVEKHLGAVMHAWSVGSRSEVVALAAGADRRESAPDRRE